MIHAVHVAVADAAAACKRANCCQTLYLSNLSRDRYGAFYFGYQAAHDLQTALPGVSVVSTDALPPESSCMQPGPALDGAECLGETPQILS